MAYTQVFLTDPMPVWASLPVTSLTGQVKDAGMGSAVHCVFDAFLLMV
jgi:hypothetical protein